MDNLLWNEDFDCAYGIKGNFESEEVFKKTVKEHYKEVSGRECNILNTRIELCICTEEGLEAGCVMPISFTDIEMLNYYISEIEEIE